MSRHLSRPRTTRLLPAAIAVLALTLSACGSEDAADDGGSASEAATSSETATSESPTEAPAEPTALTVDGAATAGKCMVPTAETLANQTTAFEGTVTAVQGGTATLQVDRWFTDPASGEASEQVTVAAPGQDMQALLVAVDFQVGTTYLVSATGDQVSLCGFSAEKTPELEAMYAEAFGA